MNPSWLYQPVRSTLVFTLDKTLVRARQRTSRVHANGAFAVGPRLDSSSEHRWLAMAGAPTSSDPLAIAEKPEFQV